MLVTTNLDLDQNQLISPVIHTTTTAPPGTEGQVYFNTVTNLLYIYYDGAWHELAVGPIVLTLDALTDVTITAAAANQMLQYNGSQ